MIAAQIVIMVFAAGCLTVIGALIVERFPSPWMVFVTFTIVLFIGWTIPSPIDFSTLGGSAQRIEVRP